MYTRYEDNIGWVAEIVTPQLDCLAEQVDPAEKEDEKRFP